VAHIWVNQKKEWKGANIRCVYCSLQCPAIRNECMISVLLNQQQAAACLKTDIWGCTVLCCFWARIMQTAAYETRCHPFYPCLLNEMDEWKFIYSAWKPSTQNLACLQRQIHTVHTCKLSQAINYQSTPIPFNFKPLWTNMDWSVVSGYFGWWWLCEWVIVASPATGPSTPHPIPPNGSNVMAYINGAYTTRSFHNHAQPGNVRFFFAVNGSSSFRTQTREDCVFLFITPRSISDCSETSFWGE